MSDLEELYQEIVMEHNRKPRNFRVPEGANRSAEGFNPFCGDTVTLHLTVADDRISDVGFQGSGCAISRASASMLTDSIKGKPREEAEKIFEAFLQMLTSPLESKVDSELLGDLEVLAGVSQFPVRVKCATLAWHTLEGALEGQEDTVSTE